MKKTVLPHVWEQYLAQWKALTGWKLFLFYALHYTLLFAILSHFVFSDFREAGKTFLWTEDAVSIYLARMTYISKTVREGIKSLLSGNGWTIPSYDFHLGPAKLELQTELFQWPAVFWPWDSIDVLYDALVVLRYYLVGLSFSIFGFYFKQKPAPVLVGAVSYTFCGFALYAGVRHPQFLAPMIFLPLLILETERVLRRERPFLLIILVFLATISNLYFACMLAIMVWLYALIRFPALYERNRLREFGLMVGRMVAGGGIGILLSGAVMLPTLLQMTGTGRIGRDVSVFTNMFHYSENYYSTFLTKFLIVPGDTVGGTWTCLGFSALSAPAILLLFINRRKETRSLRWSFLTLTPMLLIPYVGYVMSGFNTISNRWCFGYAFCVAAILMFELPQLVTADRQAMTKVTIGTLVYFLICCFIVDHNYYSDAPFVFLLAGMAVLIACTMLEKRRTAALLTACMLLTCLSTYYSAFLMYDSTQRNYVSEFAAKDVPYKYYEQSQYASFARSGVAEEENEFYRVAGSSISHEALAISYFYNINGLSFYSSSNYSPLKDWYRELELSHLSALHKSYGIIGRSHALTLANTKYYMLRDAAGVVVPFGFREVDRVQNGKNTDVILENEYALPIGYTYSSYLAREEYDNLTTLEKQEAQLQAAVLAEAPVSPQITEADVVTTAEKIPDNLSDWQGISWKGSELIVKESGATMTFTFEGLPNSVTYLRIADFHMTSGSNLIVTVETENTKAQGRFDADNYLYANGANTQMLDLGYTEDGYTTCTLTFPKKGTYTLEAVEIWCQPMDNYADQVNALREEVLENVETNWCGLTGDISVSRDKILCLSIPYDSGWSAYVDGKKVEVLQANTAFMAVELAAGDHHVELRYWTPGLTVGIIMTAAGLVGLAGLIVYWRKRKI